MTILTNMFNSDFYVMASAFACVILLVFCFVGEWFMFEKAGIEGWKSLIPIYSTYCLVKIALGNGWKFLLYLIPLYNIYFVIKVNYRLAKSYEKGGWFTVGLLIFGNLFHIILGLDDSHYVGPLANK